MTVAVAAEKVCLPLAIKLRPPNRLGKPPGAVAEALAGAGIPTERVAFFPGHDGEPGPAASAQVRQRPSMSRTAPAPRQQSAPIRSLRNPGDRCALFFETHLHQDARSGDASATRRR